MKQGNVFVEYVLCLILITIVSVYLLSYLSSETIKTVDKINNNISTIQIK